MLLYTDIINKVLNREVLPVMQQKMDRMFTSRYGENWYNIVVEPLLSKIQDYENIQEKSLEVDLHRFIV